MALSEKVDPYLRKLGLAPDSVWMRNAIQSLTQIIMEQDISARIEAGHYERNGRRRAYRNGYRKRRWQTRSGTLHLRIPRLRRGSYYPAFLTSEAAIILFELVYEAYLGVINLDRIERGLRALGLTRLKPYHLAQITEHLHDKRDSISMSPIDSHRPYLWLDAIELHQDGDIRYLLVALAFDDDGNCVGLDFELVRTADDERNWRPLLKRLIARGLQEVELVLSSDGGGLRALTQDFWPDATWLYRQMHELQDLLQLIAENNNAALVDAVSNLTIPVPQIAMKATMYQSSPTWQPVSVIMSAA